MVIRSLRRKPDLRLQRNRTMLLLAAVVLWSGALIARLVDLQVFQHDWYVQAAHTQQTAVIKLPAQRGDIFARGGQTLATSVELASVYAHPNQVVDPRAAAELLAPALQRSVESLYGQLSTNKRFVYLRRKASPEIAKAVREVIHSTGLAGIALHPDAKRYYPQRSLGAHVTGFVGIDNLGQSGVELFYDDLIRGEPGSLNTLRDGHRRVIGVRSWALENPTRGHDLILTIDWTLQFAAEVAIERAVRARGAKGGSIVAMDPNSGEILAMASYPTFNPNVRNDVAFRDHQVNQVINSPFEPGSAFKVITAAAALHEGVVTASEPIDCEGGHYAVANHTYNDSKLGFGVMPFRDVLANSSNVGTIKVCLRMSPETYFSWVTDFGFGGRTGIDLPAEHGGLLTAPSQWSKLTQSSMAFGQEIGTTPLQLATAVSASYMNIPLAHTQGGEVTGSIDESVRHGVTKLAHLHFPATQKAAQNLIRMGEDPATVHVTGCPSIDIVNETDLSLPADVFERYKGVGSVIDATKPYLVVLQHPVTTEYPHGHEQIDETIRAVSKINMQALWLWPNVDAGSDDVAKGIRVFREDEHPTNIQFLRNVTAEDYACIINNCACLVGNSSSALREGSCMGVPAVNIGTRQSGREHGENVTHAGYDAADIEQAIRMQISNGRYPRSTLYGDGSAGEQIANILATAEVRIQKRLAY